MEFLIQWEVTVCSSFMNFSLKVIRALEKRYFIGKEILILTAGYFDDSIKYKKCIIR